MSTAQSPAPLPARHTRLLLLHIVLFCLSISCALLFVQGMISLPWSFPVTMLLVWIGIWLFWRLDRRYRFDLLVWRPFARLQTAGVLTLVTLEAAALLLFGAALFAPYSSLDLVRRAMGLQGQIDLDGVYLLAYAPDSQSLLATDFDGSAALVSTAAHTLRWRINAGGVARQVAFSPDGQAVALLLSKGGLTLLRASDGALLRSIPQASGDALAFSADSTLVATAGREEPARVWRVADGALLQSLEHPRELVFLSFAADNTLTVRALQPDTGAPLLMAYSSDGRVAAQRLGGTVDLRDATSGQLLRTLRPHGQRVIAVAFSANGALLATGGSYPDTLVQVWRVADGRQVAVFANKLGASGLAFAPDGRTLVAEEFGRLVFWRLP